jgi:hypothetical protein
MSKKPPDTISPDLIDLVNAMLTSAKKDKDMALEDKKAIAELAIKLETLKLKAKDAGMGSAWPGDGDPDEPS